MSVPDSAILPNIIQQSQAGKTSSIAGGGSVSSILLNSQQPTANSFSSFVDRHHDIKPITAATSFLAGGSPRKPKLTSKLTSAPSNSQASQVRYFAGNSSISPVSASKTSAVPIINSGSQFLGALVTPKLAAPLNSSPRLQLVPNPSPALPVSSPSVTASAFNPANTLKPILSPAKEEPVWQQVTIASGGNGQGKTTCSPIGSSVRPIPIRPSPPFAIQNPQNLPSMRPLLPTASLHGTSHAVAANPPSSPAVPYRQNSPQIISCGPPMRSPVVFLDHGRFPSANGVHPSASNISPPMSTASSTQPTSVPSASASPNAVKVFSKPVVVKEKNANNVVTKKRESGGKPRKSQAPKIKTEMPDAVTPSLTPPKAVENAMVNGSGPSFHAGKRSADIDDLIPAVTKRRPKKKRIEEPQSTFVHPVPNAAVPTSPPAPVLPEGSVPVVSALMTQHPVNEDDVPDLFCHDKINATSPPPGLGNGTSNALASGNGAFCKKTRLIYDSGVRKIQQINHENHVATAPVTVVTPPVSAEKPVLGSISPPNVNVPEQREPGKKPRRPRKPREPNPHPRTKPKSQKSKPVITITRVVPVSVQMKHAENEEQRTDRLRRLALRWSSLSENQIQWLLATKSVNQLKIFRWLRLVDRASLLADSAKNFEKVEKLRDSKIHAIMDLEKLQAPYEPRLMHFLHAEDVEKKNRLIKKYFNGEALLKKELKWLREHYDRLCEMEKTLPGLDASTDSMGDGSHCVPVSLPSLLPGNERGNFQPVIDGEQPSTSKMDMQPSTSAEPPAARFTALQPFDFTTVQAAHEFIRKFPNTTKAMVEVKPNGIPCAVLLLWQLQNSKAVHIKKVLKEPPGGFESREVAFKAAAALLDHLVVKYLCLPSYPVHVRYPISPGFLNEHFPVDPAAPGTSQLNFNRDVRGWETVQYISAPDLSGSQPSSWRTFDADLIADFVTPQSLTQNYRQVYPSCFTENDQVYLKFQKDISSRNTINLCSMANDPIGQRQWLSWECRHISQQYFELDACQQAREKWVSSAAEEIKKKAVPETTLARISRLSELMKDGGKRPRNTTAVVTKTIKIGEQVKDILESYKKERPMTRRKKAAISAAARNQLMDR